MKILLRKRIIPVLLLKDKGLVKGKKFNNYKYIGDPINAIRIFNDKEVDELIFLDIEATNSKSVIESSFVKKLADECYMPFTVGGGITSIDQIRELLKSGAEKICLCTSAINDPSLIKDAADYFGSQSVVVSIDVSKDWWGRRVVMSKSSTIKTSLDPISWAQEVESFGVGEILLNCVYLDGIMEGYDVDFANTFCNSVNVPVIVSGGAGNFEDFEILLGNSSASAAAGGSVFVFHGPLKGVLISYPSKKLKFVR